MSDTEKVERMGPEIERLKAKNAELQAENEDFKDAVVELPEITRCCFHNFLLSRSNKRREAAEAARKENEND